MISLKRLSIFNLLILLGVGCAGHVFAQQPPLAIKPVRPSQKASVMQTIGVTDITITYSRPPVKGRTIFADRSEERRVGKSVDLGGRRIIKKKKKRNKSTKQHNILKNQ